MAQVGLVLVAAAGVVVIVGAAVVGVLLVAATVLQQAVLAEQEFCAEMKQVYNIFWHSACASKLSNSVVVKLGNFAKKNSKAITIAIVV